MMSRHGRPRGIAQFVRQGGLREDHCERDKQGFHVTLIQ
jgi:hypothetical protein